MASTYLGRLVCTAGVGADMRKDAEFERFVYKCMERFIKNQDWGDIDEADEKQNDLAYSNPRMYGRIVAVYKNESKTLWIIREGDCSVTTLLYPEEY
jgi:hypothetical protein